MRSFIQKKLTTLAALTTLSVAALAIPLPGMLGVANAIEFTHWPKEAGEKLSTLIESKANQGNYAVFDMDNTTYQNDLEEGLLAYLEEKGVITRDTIDPSLKLIPFMDKDGAKESLFSYYYRLCEIDDRVCYPWVAQVFSGLTLRELKGHVDDMMAGQKPITVTLVANNGEVSQTNILPPKVTPGQQELFKALMDNGISVYIVSAAHEELVRMVASDPKYGYKVKPENVVGVTTLLKDQKTGEVTTSALQINRNAYDQNANLDLELTPNLMSPTPWLEGKPAAIIARIDRYKRPILVAGDSPASDGFMLMDIMAEDGVKVWVNHSEKNMAVLNKMMIDNAKHQEALKLPVIADKNWIIVTPEQIGK